MRKKGIINFVIIAFFIVGLLSICSPYITSLLSLLHSTRVIVNYDLRVRATEQTKNVQPKFLPSIYSFDIYSNLKGQYVKEEPHKQVIREGEMIGYIVIPKVNILLPIYEGKTDAILQKGVGHISLNDKAKVGSLPGKDNHCVLVGHSGLASAKLFTDLDKTKLNDIFYIKIKNKVYEYKIVNISIKTPNEAENELRIFKGKDLCSLITCVPVPINSHRLLVTGERISYDGRFNSNELIKTRNYFYSITSIACGILIFVLFLISFVRRFKYEKKN